MRVSICLPTQDTMMVDTACSIFAAQNYLLRERRDISLTLINEKQTLLDISRHRLVMKALKLKSDYIMWIDSDMKFSHDAISRLVDSDKDIIGCQALMRAFPFASNTYDFDHKQVLYTDDVVEVKYIGTGFLLVKLDVFNKIGKPYFKCTYDENREIQWQGEDLNFCDRAREAGFKIFCHGPLSKKLYHIGTKNYGFEEPKPSSIKKE